MKAGCDGFGSQLAAVLLLMGYESVLGVLPGLQGCGKFFLEWKEVTVCQCRHLCSLNPVEFRNRRNESKSESFFSMHRIGAARSAEEIALMR